MLLWPFKKVVGSYMEFNSQTKSTLNAIEKTMEKMIKEEDSIIYGVLWPFISRGGKRIRPALSALSLMALGGNVNSIVIPASIIELFHNFTLIHDDIEDESQFRRGHPTMHIAHGIATALNSGDALYTLIWKNIVELSSDKELQKLYVEGFKRVVDGQGHEINWIQTSKFDVTEEEYLKMISGKTAALMGLSCEIGAYFSKKAYREKLRDYGEKIGLAFQIQDDVLNLTGEFDKYQKEIGGDITEGKRTLIVVHCLKHSKDGNRLKEILSSKDPKLINEAISIMENSESIEYARKFAKNLIQDAKKDLSDLPESQYKQSLINLADYVISREL